MQCSCYILRIFPLILLILATTISSCVDDASSLNDSRSFKDIIEPISDLNSSDENKRYSSNSENQEKEVKMKKKNMSEGKRYKIKNFIAFR